MHGLLLLGVKRTNLVGHVEGSALGEHKDRREGLGANSDVFDGGVKPTVGLTVHRLGTEGSGKKEDILFTLNCLPVNRRV